MTDTSFDVQIRCGKTLRKKYRLSVHRLRTTACAVLQKLGWEKAAVSIWLVGDRQIRSLNKQYLKHDRATDVIAFSQLEGRALKGSAGGVFLGDLVISLDRAARQAVEYKNPFFYELAFYLCHGILHLMGYSDASKKQALWMERKQAAVLKKIGIEKEWRFRKRRPSF